MDGKVITRKCIEVPVETTELGIISFSVPSEPISFIKLKP